MSKQTNAFQQLIHYIHEKTEGIDATITESAEIFEQNINEKIPREVDILIEKEINGKNNRIAIECRDRQCKDDIQWVDCLIGKYLHLDVQKVIAVSNSGYSKAAQLKAGVNHIELKTLEEARNIDFYDEFVKIGMAKFFCNFELQQFSLECTPQCKFEITPQLKVFEEDREISTLDELVSHCTEGTNIKIKQYFNQNFLNIFKTKADLNKHVLIEHKIPINGLFVQSPDNLSHKLLSITLLMVGKSAIDEVEVMHRFYESALVTEGKIQLVEFDKEQTLFVAQTAKANEGKIFVKSKKIKAR
ncbi:restriction endonuclease [Methyloglobulus sp.]|uniref:restriction endonuclease n=1 Tax=Methyloglobulus sp. TaxID=2518622 RepID=UPI0032B784A1